MSSNAPLPTWFQAYRSLSAIRKIPFVPPEEESAAPPKPELNGRLLINPAGTIWQVIDGFARGFVSENLFLRIHYWSRVVQWGDCGSFPRGGGVCGQQPQAVQLSEVADVPAFIAEQAPFDPSIGLIRNQAGTVCLYESNTKRLVPTADVMESYQFDWNKVATFPDNVFDSIPTGPPLPVPG